MESFLNCEEKGLLSSYYVKRWFYLSDNSNKLYSYSDSSKNKSTEKLSFIITKECIFVSKNKNENNENENKGNNYQFKIKNKLTKNYILLIASSLQLFKRWEESILKVFNSFDSTSSSLITSPSSSTSSLVTSLTNSLTLSSLLSFNPTTTFKSQDIGQTSLPPSLIHQQELKVIVLICNKENHFITITDYPIYIVQIVYNSYILSQEYHYYPDLRTVHNKLKKQASNIKLQSIFPKPYRRTLMGINLTESEIIDRKNKIQFWLQELFNLFPLTLKEEFINLHQRIASLYGCTKYELETIKSNPSKIISDNLRFGTFYDYQSNNNYESNFDNKSHTSDISNTNDTSDNNNNNKDNIQKKILLPPNSKELKKWSILNLAQACLERNIDCSKFRGRRQYVNSLTQTYYTPFFQDKDSRQIMNQLILHKNEYSNDIDIIFYDICKRLDISDDQSCNIFEYYSIDEKVELIIKTISIWDNEIYITKEDNQMIHHLLFSLNLDPFILLTLLYRISNSNTSNQWLNKFSIIGGIHAISTTFNRLLEISPRSLIISGHLLYLLRCIRSIINSTDHQLLILETRGLIESIIYSFSFEFKVITLETLDILTEIMIFGGNIATHKIINGFKQLADDRNEQLFEIFSINLLIQDFEIKCAIIGFINTLLLCSKDAIERILIRKHLVSLEFDKSINLSLLNMNNKDNNNNKDNEILKKVDQTIKLRSGVTISSDLLQSQYLDKNGIIIENKSNNDLNNNDQQNIQINEENKSNEDNNNNNSVDFKYYYEINILEGKMASWVNEILPHPLIPPTSFVSSLTSTLSLQGIKTIENTIKSAESIVNNLTTYLSDQLVQDNTNSKLLNLSTLSKDTNIKKWYQISNNQYLQRSLLIPNSNNNFNNNFNDNLNDSNKNLTIIDNDIIQIDLKDLIDIIDYTNLHSQPNLKYENSLTLIFKNNLELHLTFENIHIKLQWIVALQSIKDKLQFQKSPYQILTLHHNSKEEDISLQNSEIFNNYKNHVNMYNSIIKEDLLTFHSNILPDFLLESKKYSLLQQEVITNFIFIEFKIRKNEHKYLSLMEELVHFIIENYKPIEEEIEEKINYNKAVTLSTRETPRPPPLPLPKPKSIQKRNLLVQPFFWDIIKPIHVYNTIWMEMKEIQLDWNLIDQSFAIIKNSTKSSTSSTMLTKSQTFNLSTSKKLSIQSNKISLFESKRIQNIEIARNKLRLNDDLIYDLIVNLDPEYLTQDIKDILVNLVLPTSEELNIIELYQGSIDDLDFCGKLYYKFLSIDRLFTRLTIHDIISNFSNEYNIISRNLQVVQNALLELNNPICSSSLYDLLSIILSIGNYMNGSTNRGGAHGFQLNTLLKLSTKYQTTIVNSSNTKYKRRKTMLHFIISQFLTHFPNHQPFYINWNLMWIVPKITYQNTLKQIEKLEELINYCKKEYEICLELMESKYNSTINKVDEIKNENQTENENKVDDNNNNNNEENVEENENKMKSLKILIQKLESFLESSLELFEELNIQLHKTIKMINSTKRYYGEFMLGESTLQNENNDSWSTFLQLIVSFAEMYRTSMSDIEDWKKADEKIQENVISLLNKKPKINKIIKESNNEVVDKNDHSSPLSIPSHMTKDQVFNYFKDQLVKIRNRNATKKQEDSDNDNDSDDDDYE